MARAEQEREDLLRDARALVPRIQLAVDVGGRLLDVFAGFRGEALSLFFDQDPVYHFNAAGQLRRAFLGGRLIKAERHQLVALDRVRTAAEVVLARDELDEAAEQELLQQAADNLSDLAGALRAGKVEVTGQFPEQSDALARLVAWLSNRRTLEVAAASRL